MEVLFVMYRIPKEKKAKTGLFSKRLLKKVTLVLGTHTDKNWSN